MLAGISMLSRGELMSWSGLIAVILVAATPLIRVGWLIFRWWQERDWQFIWAGVGLLGAIAIASGIVLIQQ
jgi:hypothetical protein